MTVLFAGGEDTSFTVIGAWTINAVTVTIFRNIFCRVALVCTPSALVADPPARRLQTPIFAASSIIWLHGQYGSNTSPTNSTTLNQQCIRLLDSTGVARIVMRGTGTDGQWKISKRDAAGSLTDLVTSTANNAANLGTRPSAIDLFINYAVAGQATLYIDGINVADTGPGIDVTTNSVTALAQAEYCPLVSSASATAGWSECIIKTTTTLGVALQTIPPLAAGTTQSWTGVVASINETTISDATIISTPTNNALSEWTVSTALPSGNWLIDAIVQEARVSVGVTGPQHFEWLVRTADGTDHVTGNIAPNTSFANYANIWPINPFTGIAWLPGNLIQAGIESLA